MLNYLTLLVNVDKNNVPSDLRDDWNMNDEKNIQEKYVYLHYFIHTYYVINIIYTVYYFLAEGLSHLKV